MAPRGGGIRYYVDAETGAFSRALGDVDRRMDLLGRTGTRVFAGLGIAAATGTAAVGAGLVASVKAAGDFEQALANVSAVSGANRLELKRLGDQALDLGAKTKFSAMEAAAGQAELAKAGLSVKEILGGGLDGTLALAAAGDLELADAATIAANSMKLFGLAGKDVTMIADAMATAANTTTADVGDFGMAMSQGGAAARLAGLDFKDTMVILEALADAGVKNSDAGTAMKAGLLQLINPTEKQAALQKRLGLSFIDSNGKMKDAQGIAAELIRETKDMEQAERAKTFAVLAGTDGLRVLNAIYEAGPKKLDAYEKALGRQGTAADVAAKKQQSFQARLEQLDGAMETIKIRIGNAIIPSLTRLADHALSDLMPKLDTAAKGIEQIWNRPGLTPEERFSASWDAIAATGVPDQVKEAIYQGLTVVGTNGPRFIMKGLQEAPWPAKGVMAAILLAKLGPAMKLVGGGLIPGLTAGAGGRGLASTVAGRAAPIPVIVTNPGFGAPGGGLTGGGKGAPGVVVPGLAGRLAGGGIGAPLAGGAALIAGGMALDRADQKYGLFGSSRAENAAKFQARIDAEIAAWRKGGPALQKEIQKYSMADQSGNVAKIKAEAQRGIDAFASGVASRGPKVTKSMDAVINGALKPIQGMTPTAGRLAADSIVRMTAQMESKGKATRGTTKALVDALTSQFGRLPPMTRRLVAQAITPLEAFNRSLSRIRTAAGDTASAVESSVSRWVAAANRAPTASIVPSWLMSSGGLIPGTYTGVDTIPAMLSPGEVVLNPTQQRIVGIDRIMETLARTGGQVGGNRFAVGGVAGRASRYVNPFPGGNWAGGPSAHAARALGNWQSDNAWDIMGSTGQAVYAVLPGTIGRVSASDSRGGFAGQGVYLHTADGQWWYKHIKASVSPGQKVNAGDVIGTLVSWTNGGPHLHLATPSGDPARARSGMAPGAARGSGRDDDGRDGGGGSTAPRAVPRILSRAQAARATRRVAAGGLGSGSPMSVTDRVTELISDRGRDDGLVEYRARASGERDARGAGVTNEEKVQALGEKKVLEAQKADLDANAEDVKRAAAQVRSGIVSRRERLKGLYATLRRQRKPAQRAKTETAINRVRDEIREHIDELRALIKQGADIEADAELLGYQIGALVDQITAMPDAAPADPSASDPTPTGPTPDQQAQLDQANARADVAENESRAFGAFVSALKGSGDIDPRSGTVIVNVGGSLVHESQVASWLIGNAERNSSRRTSVMASPA